jgi:hypothetical protein
MIKTLAETPGFSKVEVSLPFGEKRIIAFRLLKGREASFVLHSVLRPAVSAIVGTLSGGGIMDGLTKALETLDFETAYEVLGKKLILGAVIEDQKPIATNADFENYFGENAHELYPLVIAGVLVNYPKVFSKLREAMSASPELVEKAAALM